jgi:hypothetical protein
MSGDDYGKFDRVSHMIGLVAGHVTCIQNLKVIYNL